MHEIFKFCERANGRLQGNMVGHFEATGIRPQFLQDLVAFGIEVPSGIFEPGRRL